MLALLAVLVLTPVSSLAADKIDIRFATQSMDTKTSALYKLLMEFQDEHPEVNLIIEEAPGNDLITKINTDIMARNCPDIFTYWRPEHKWNFDLYTSPEVDAIADLTELKNSEFYADLYPEFTWKTATLNGVVVGIPRLNFYTCFIVNKTIFDKLNLELPTDWDKLVKACEVLKENGYIPWATDTGEGLDDASRLFNMTINSYLGNARGLSLMTGQESWKQEDVLAALESFLSVCKAGYCPEDSSVLNDSDVISKYLNTGRAAMLVQNASQVWRNIPGDVMDQFVALNFPLPNGSQVEKAQNELDLTNLIYCSKTSFEDSAKKDILIELMHKLTSNEAGKLYAEFEKLIVPHLHADIDESLVHPLQQEAARLAYDAQSCKWLLSRTSSDVVDDFRLTINAVWYGDITTADALADALDDALFGKQ